MSSPKRPIQPKTARAELERLATQHRPWLRSAAATILRSPESQEEAVQAALLRALEALPSFRGESRMATWLWRIVVNKAKDIATEARSLPLEDLEILPEPPSRTQAPELDSKLSADCLRQSFEETLPLLTPFAAQVLQLRAEGHTYRTIARRLRSALGTVHSAGREAQDTLRERLHLNTEPLSPSNPSRAASGSG